MPRILSDEEIEEFRGRLVEAASHLFAERGRDAVSMRELASALGVSAMTPYRYFKDKDEILAAVRTRAFDQFAQTLEDVWADTQGDGPARSAAVGRAYADFAFANPEAYRLMFDVVQGGEDQYPELVRATERARHTMTRHLEPLIEAGLVEGDRDVIGHALWAMMHGAIELEMAGKLSDACGFERIVQAGIGAMLRGVAPRGGDTNGRSTSGSGTP